MTYIQMLQLSQEMCSITYQTNGIHIFYSYSFQGKIIKYFEYLSLKNMNYNVKIAAHLGCKYQIKDNFWILTLFTSQEKINFYDMVIDNIKLTGNIHQYVNQSFIIENGVFSAYFTITDDLNFGPKYLKSEQIPFIVDQSIDAFKIAVKQSDFNNPLVLMDTLYEHLINLNSNTKSSFKSSHKYDYLSISKKSEYLRMWGFTNDDIYKFTENFSNNKTIHGEFFHKNNLYNSNPEIPKHIMF